MSRGHAADALVLLVVPVLVGDRRDDDAWRTAVTTIPCQKCGGEGRIYKSRYGGNDPDVWDARECDQCHGDGDQRCEARGCDEDATAFNSDGEALCQDCLTEWVAMMAGED